jgi:hypothetical protein
LAARSLRGLGFRVVSQADLESTAGFGAFFVVLDAFMGLPQQTALPARHKGHITGAAEFSLADWYSVQEANGNFLDSLRALIMKMDMI